ncbi:hypothetical protein Tco_1338290 [Tanacetum coccineum]
MEAPLSTVDGHHRATHRTSRIDLWHLGRMYASGRVDIFDMVDIDLFTVVALNMMVLKLGLYALACEEDVRCMDTLVRSFKLIEVYIEHGVTVLDSYLRAPRFRATLEDITDEPAGLYALACEEDVRCLATLVRSFKLIEVYIEHGVTVLDSYLRAPRFRATLEDITDEPACSIAANRTEKMLLLTCMSLVNLLRNLLMTLLHLALYHNMIQVPLLSGVHGVDTQSHVLPTIQSQFSDINMSFISQQATASQVIDDVMRQLSFDETELDRDAGFADVARSGMDSSGLSHDESFRVDDLDLNLNKDPYVNLNVSQVETQFELPMSEEPDVGHTQEPILAEVSTKAPIVEEVGTQEFNVEDVVIEDYVSSGEDGEDAEQDNDEENEIVEPDVDVRLFGISKDLPFDNIGITNLVSDDVLEGEDVDVINADGFNSDPSNDKERNYRKRSPKEAKDRVYLHSTESRRNLKLYKNDSVRIRARYEGKVHVFTMSQGTGSTDPNSGMEAGPSGSSGPTTRSKKGIIQIIEQVRVNMDIPVKAVQYQLQRELESINPNTTVKIAVERNTDPSLPTRVFQRIYVCLGALKLGFRAYKRDLLGLDGAFMKGSFPGQVLVVCLGDDIDLHPYSNFTFISDRQKGIISAIKTIYPSRAKSDLLLNNICEVFNGKIVKGRDKPVITLLEYIREYCMKRIVNVQGVIDKCTGPLTPTITRIMESIKKEAHLMKVQWNGANKYQVLGSLGDQCVVDVVSGTTLRNLCKSLLLLEYIEGNILSQDTTNLCDQVLGEVHMSNNTFATQASCPGGSGVGAVIGLSAATGEGGAGDPGGAMSQTRNADGREMGDGVPTQSSTAGGASEWSFL